MDQTALQRAIAECIRDQLGLSSDHPIRPSALLVEELGLDSLRALFLIADLEERLRVDLSSLEALPATLKDLAEECGSRQS